MLNQSLQIIVIGGGAAGFFGAIAAAKTYPQHQVILLEAGREPLAKVRVSGGGRCNVTHACFEPAILVQHYPRGGKALRGAFSRFQPRDTIQWFSQYDVELKTESDGRMFPITDNSETIIDCLMYAAEDVGVQLYKGTPVVTVKRVETHFEVILKSGEKFQADRVLLATGSNPLGYKWARELGHTIETPVPSLFTFNIKDERLQDLAGVSANNVIVRLPEAKLEQTGPLLITHWGVSGPGVLKLSAWGARFLSDCHYKTPLLINWLPQYKPDKLKELLLIVKSQLGRKVISSNCPVPIPRRLWEKLVSYIGIDEEKHWAEMTNQSLNQLIQELTNGQYKITGKGVFKEEFVTCGGIKLKEVDFKTMESRLTPGLYFAGEILDIDGVTGGFNFQSAWTTSWLAGQAIGKG